MVLAETPIAANLSQGAFHNPASRQHLEAHWENRRLNARWQPDSSFPVWFPDDLRPPSDLLDPGNKRSLVSAIREQQRDTRTLILCGLQQQTGTVTILNICWMDFYLEKEPLRVREDMPLPAFDFLPCIVPARPPFSVVLTDWLSMMRADGCGSRPIPIRTNSRRVQCTSSHAPWRFHARNWL